MEYLKEKNKVLVDENMKLREMFKKSNENVKTERELLLRSVKYMERLRLRDKNVSSNMGRKTLVRDLRALDLQQTLSG
jgi:hypothetical protein